MHSPPSIYVNDASAEVELGNHHPAALTLTPPASEEINMESFTTTITPTTTPSNNTTAGNSTMATESNPISYSSFSTIITTTTTVPSAAMSSTSSSSSILPSHTGFHRTDATFNMRYHGSKESEYFPVDAQLFQSSTCPEHNFMVFYRFAKSHCTPPLFSISLKLSRADKVDERTIRLHTKDCLVLLTPWRTVPDVVAWMTYWLDVLDFGRTCPGGRLAIKLAGPRVHSPRHSRNNSMEPLNEIAE